MVRGSKGFTLIELMIVIAIVGILASLSIPLYQGYVVKSQMNRVVGELGRYRVSIEDSIGSNRPVTNEDISYAPSDLTTGDLSTDIATINPDGSGHLQVTLGGNAHPTVTGVVIQFQRTASGQWTCVIDNSANPSGWSDMYLPSGCTL